MKLSVVYFPNDLGHPSVRAILGDSIASKEIPWGSALSEQCLATFSALSGCSIRLCFSFTDKQCESYSHFILRPKHLVAESDAVLAANADYMRQQPLHHRDEFGRYRLRDRLFVGTLKPQFDRIWSLEFSGGYLVADTLQADMLSRFSGLYDVPLLHYKSRQAVEGWRAFGSATWLEKLHFDDTVEMPIAEDGMRCLRPMGMLSASAADLESLPDIARLPSATVAGDSEYIVSQRVWRYWREQGIKSFRPDPLLAVASSEYHQYRELIGEVRSKLMGANPANFIRS